MPVPKSAMVAVAWYLLTDNANPHPLKIFSWTILITVPAFVIFSVAIPQAWAKYAGEPLLAMAWPFLALIHFLLWPVVRVLADSFYCPLFAGCQHPPPRTL